MAVATVPFNPDVLALFRLAYPSRAGTEIESTELLIPVRVQQTGAAQTGELGEHEQGPTGKLEKGCPEGG